MTTATDGSLSAYRFADLTLDVARRCVTRQGRSIELKSLDFDLLRFLVESAPNVVNADVLAEKVWGRHFVSPENVAQRVMLLRQSLTDDANRPRYIETVRNKGYRLIPPVEIGPRGPTVVAGRRPWLVPAAAALLIAVCVTGAAGYWLTGTAERPPPLPRSVAVLPFENLSPDRDDAFFAGGMQDEIVSQLTKISGLRVFLVASGKDTQRSVMEVTRDFNVATTLGGSVYYSNGRVRVIPRLIDATTGASLWSQPYERELDNIFAIRSEIALEVAKELRLELSASERERIERVPTSNPRARELYLMARAREWRYTRTDEVLRAVDEVEEALALDPEFKDAWQLAASVHAYAQYLDPERTQAHRLRAEQAARHALLLDPELGEPYLPIGASALSNKEWIAAEAAFRSAADRNVPLALLGPYGILKLSAGDFAAAREIWEEGRATNPQVATGYRFLAFIYEGLGERTRAKALYEASTAYLFPDDEREVAAILVQRMHWLVGRNELADARTIVIGDPLNAAMLARLDTPERALAELRLAFASGDSDPNRLRDIGLWAGHFGDAALAFDAMRAAVNAQGGQMVYIWLPQLAPMRKLPAFRAYMQEIGIVAYWQKFGWPPFCRQLSELDFECD